MTDDELNRDYGGWLSAPSWLSAFELKVVRDAVAGEVAEPPHTADGAPDLRAMVVRRLFLGLDDGWLLTPLGLRVKGARIVGKLDLAGLSAAGGGYLPPLDLAACTFTDEICLGGTRIDDVRLDGADFPRVCAKGLVLARGFSAENAVCQGEILLENCRAGDGVSLTNLRACSNTSKVVGPTLSLTGAVLTGDLILNRAFLFSPGDEAALNLIGACIRNIELTAATILGRTEALALKVQVQFSANDSWFESRDGFALSLDSAELGGAYFDRSTMIGGVVANSASIKGEWSAQQAYFENAGDCALSLGSAQAGVVLLDGSTMIGAVLANGATIKRSWSANQAYFESDGDSALSLDSAAAGWVSLIGAVVRGQAWMPRVRVSGVINAQGARFFNPADVALNLSGCQVDGRVGLEDWWQAPGMASVARGAEICGQLDLTQARIGSDLSLGGIQVTAPDKGSFGGLAIDAWECEVKGSVLMKGPTGRRCRVTGAVNLGGGAVHGDVDMTNLLICRRSPIAAPAEKSEAPAIAGARAQAVTGTFSRLDLDHVAVSMVGAEIGGNLTLRRIGGNLPTKLAMGDRTQLASAAAEGDLDCVGRPWNEPQSPLSRLENDVAGCFDLSQIAIGRDLIFDGARLSASEADEATARGGGEGWRTAATALSLHGATIGKALRVTDLDASAGIVDLRGAACGELVDEGGHDWGAEPVVLVGRVVRGYRLDLEGFTYGSLDGEDAFVGGGQEKIAAGHSLWERRTRWLRRQFRPDQSAEPVSILAHPGKWRDGERARRRAIRDNYSPQPWGQLAATLRAAGRDDDARRVTIAHYDFRMANVEPPLWMAWSVAVRFLFGYGYSPLRVLRSFAALLFVGWLSTSHWVAADARAARARLSTPCERLGLLGSSVACPFLVTPDKGDKAAAPPESLAARLAAGPRPVTPCDKKVQPLLFAIDVFVPVNLKEQERCDINPNREFWRFMKAVYAVLGWIFTPLAALTFAGVLKRN